MGTSSFAAASTERVVLRRLWWLGPLTIAAAVAGVLLVRIVAVTLLPDVAQFPPLGWGFPIIFTIIGVLGAVLVFAMVGRLTRRPVSLFRRLALGVLVVSFVPDVLLLEMGAMPGTSVLSVGALAVMHVVAWMIAVRMLTTLTRDDSVPQASIVAE